MNTQPVKTENEIFDSAKTVLGELKAIILKKQEQERVAAQPKIAVDHLKEEAVLEPVQGNAQITSMEVANVEPQVQVIEQPVSNPTVAEPQVIEQPVNNVTIPEPIVANEPSSIINTSVEEINNYVAPMQTELIDVNVNGNNSQYVVTPTSESSVEENLSGNVNMQVPHVEDYSIPNIDMSANLINNNPPVSNPSTVQIEPIPNALDTGVVQLPSGTNSEITNDPTMVVGPEAFTKSI